MFITATARVIRAVRAILDYQVLRKRMDQFRFEVVLRCHRCRECLVSECHPLSCVVHAAWYSRWNYFRHSGHSFASLLASRAGSRLDSILSSIPKANPKVGGLFRPSVI